MNMNYKLKYLLEKNSFNIFSILNLFFNNKTHLKLKRFNKNCVNIYYYQKELKKHLCIKA